VHGRGWLVALCKAHARQAAPGRSVVLRPRLVQDLQSSRHGGALLSRLTAF
jgi:hypothetical protein